MFNRWVEAVPSKDQSATTVIKFLTGEVKTSKRNTKFQGQRRSQMQTRPEPTNYPRMMPSDFGRV